MADLITQEYLLQLLAAGGLAPDADQLAHLPSATAAASETIRRECGGRDFARRTYVEQCQPDRDGLAYLRQIPVNAVLRVVAPTRDAFLITNSSAGNQVATVRFATTGSVTDGTAAAIGLTLTSVASGLASSVTLAFVAYPTLGTLAAAISAAGSGWSASVDASYLSWSSSDLEGADVGRSALGPGASLGLYASELGGSLEPRTGVLRVGTGTGLAGLDTPRWGPDWSSFSGSQAAPARVRVTYDAGFDAVPDPIQQATAEMVKSTLERLSADSTVVKETLGRYSYEQAAAASLPLLSAASRAAIASYRISRA